MLELCIINLHNYNEIVKSNIFHKINNICCSSSQICLPELSTLSNIAMLVDYPFGLANTKVREHEVLYGSRANIKYIDVTISDKNLEESDFKRILNEIYVFQNILKKTQIELRIILNVVNLDNSKIIDISSCLEQKGINTMIIGNGIYNTEIQDLIIIAKHIQKLTSLNCIISTQFCTKNNFELITNSKIYGLRLSSLQSLERLLKSGV